MGFTTEAKLVVKHTFLEFSTPRESRRHRAHTDSAILAEACWGREKEVSLCSVNDAAADPTGECSMNSAYGLPINTYEGGLDGYGEQELAATWWQQQQQQCSAPEAANWNCQSMDHCNAQVPGQWGWWAPSVGYEQASCMAGPPGVHEQASVACPSSTVACSSSGSNHSEGGLDLSETRTTVMLRNMPNDYTRGMLMDLLDTEGFEGCYDFVYLPVDFNTMSGLGYAFVNLTAPSEAVRFWQHFDSFSRWSIPSDKVCTLNWSSPHQGLESHIERYRNSPVMHEAVPDNCKPLLIINGVRVPFPPATKKVKAPRIRCRP